MGAAKIVSAPKFSGLKSHSCARCAHEDLAKPIFVEIDGAVVALGPRCAALAVYGTATKATAKKAILAAEKAESAAEEAARAARAAETKAVVAFALDATGLAAEHAAAFLPGKVAQKAIDALGGLEAAREIFFRAAQNTSCNTD